ncbi:MAG: c-type cytochrome biogenesis protein CcmI [Betaproteobacteria bacterium]|nr:MAG: c-type cytochrome biogenesis protein CcmI [Betaproteobacteria bacterium]
MTLFWLTGAALAVLALVLVLRPLLAQRAGGPVSRTAANISIYRDQLRELEGDLAAGTLAQADYERARAELEARLLEDVREQPAPAARPAGWLPVIATVALVPVVALVVYFAVGNPAALVRQPEAHISPQQVEAMVQRLADKMRANPNDIEGWKLLGRSYAALGRFDQAVDAFAKAAAGAPRDPDLLADFADVLAMARDQKLDGEPEKLVRRALELDPNHLKSLALAGTAAYERKDYAAAAAYWQRMLPNVQPGSEDARVIQQNVNEARALAGIGGEAAKPQAPKAAQASKAAVRGTVTLSPQLKSKASPDDTVYVFARAAEGPPLPLAIARTRVRDLPYSFQLDDSMAMNPAMNLSAFPKVVVTARVSKSGNAAPQAGDLQGASGPVANDAGAVNIVIDSQVR